MKTQAEVHAFLDSLVGTTVIEPTNPELNGECVTLIKALLNFMRVPYPWKARGHAKDFGDSCLNEGIAKLAELDSHVRVYIRRTPGDGHIWCSVGDYIVIHDYYESNGSAGKIVSKNTKGPLSICDQIITFDQWMAGGGTPPIPTKSKGKRHTDQEVKAWDGHRWVWR